MGTQISAPELSASFEVLAIILETFFSNYFPTVSNILSWVIKESAHNRSSCLRLDSNEIFVFDVELIRIVGLWVLIDKIPGSSNLHAVPFSIIIC